MRRADAADIPAIRRFLDARAEVAMFPLVNLAAHGLAADGGDNPDRAMHVWIDGAGDTVTHFIAITEEGMLLPVLPSDAASHWGAVAQFLRGRQVIGMAGAADAARPGFAALDLAAQSGRKDADEPLFSLDLARMIMPELSGLELRKPGSEDIPVLEAFRAASLAELHMAAPGREAEVARRDVARALEHDTFRLLLRDGVPVAKAGINAAIGDIVQVGGVYTPPELRRQGLARAAVALMLAERREGGANRAVLFAASENAARAYVSIGFGLVGAYTLTLFDPPERIAA